MTEGELEAKVASGAWIGSDLDAGVIDLDCDTPPRLQKRMDSLKAQHQLTATAFMLACADLIYGDDFGFAFSVGDLFSKIEKLKDKP